MSIENIWTSFLSYKLLYPQDTCGGNLLGLHRLICGRMIYCRSFGFNFQSLLPGTFLGMSKKKGECSKIWCPANQQKVYDFSLIHLSSLSFAAGAVYITCRLTKHLVVASSLPFRAEFLIIISRGLRNAPSVSQLLVTYDIVIHAPH